MLQPSYHNMKKCVIASWLIDPEGIIMVFFNDDNICEFKIDQNQSFRWEIIIQSVSNNTPTHSHEI